MTPGGLVWHTVSSGMGRAASTDQPSAAIKAHRCTREKFQITEQITHSMEKRCKMYDVVEEHVVLDAELGLLGLGSRGETLDFGSEGHSAGERARMHEGRRPCRRHSLQR